MAVVLHRKALERPLVQMPPTLAVPMSVPSVDVGRRQPLHEPRQLAVFPRPQQHVPVVGHQAISQQSNGHRLQRRFQDPLEGGVVGIVGKQFPAVIPTVETVEYHAAGRYPS
jgi:hypothetical protein